jgi:hypothetical protein
MFQQFAHAIILFVEKVRTVTTVMHKQGISRLGVLDEPSECIQNILTRWHGVRNIVSEGHHMCRIGWETKLFDDECFNVDHVIDTTSKFRPSALVIDTDKQRFLISCTSRKGNIRSIVQAIILVRSSSSRVVVAVGFGGITTVRDRGTDLSIAVQVHLEFLFRDSYAQVSTELSTLIQKFIKHYYYCKRTDR